jgi:uncharacterized membrane protein
MLRTLAAAFALIGCLGLAHAAEAPPNLKDLKGVYLLTDYPALTIRAGATSTVGLKLQNYGLPPQRLSLHVDGVPQGWHATLLGGGQPVAAAMTAAGSDVNLQLRIDVPKEATTGTQTLTVVAEGAGEPIRLPIAVTLAKDLPAKLAVDADLPALRGTPRSAFDYQLSIKNDSGKELLVSLAAQAPQNFETSFTEAYGTQELTSVPVKAGESKSVKLHVRPPTTVDAGKYPVAVTVSAEDASAKTTVTLDVTGEPQLHLTGRDERLSASAEAGTESTVALVVTNNGSAPAENVTLSGTAPSGWKISFDPKTVDRLAPGDKKEVQALITPPAKAIAGDYMTTIRAGTGRENASSDFRVTVSTSTLWGIVGIGIVAVALLLLFGAVVRYGRR